MKSLDLCSNGSQHFSKWLICENIDLKTMLLMVPVSVRKYLIQHILISIKLTITSIIWRTIPQPRRPQEIRLQTMLAITIVKMTVLKDNADMVRHLVSHLLPTLSQRITSLKPNSSGVLTISEELIFSSHPKKRSGKKIT